MSLLNYLLSMKMEGFEIIGIPVFFCGMTEENEEIKEIEIECQEKEKARIPEDVVEKY